MVLLTIHEIFSNVATGLNSIKQIKFVQNLSKILYLKFLFREAAKQNKKSFFSGPAIKRGGGVRGLVVGPLNTNKYDKNKYNSSEFVTYSDKLDF